MNYELSLTKRLLSKQNFIYTNTSSLTTTMDVNTSNKCIGELIEKNLQFKPRMDTLFTSTLLERTNIKIEIISNTNAIFGESDVALQRGWPLYIDLYMAATREWHGTFRQKYHRNEDRRQHFILPKHRLASVAIRNWFRNSANEVLGSEEEMSRTKTFEKKTPTRNLLNLSIFLST